MILLLYDRPPETTWWWELIKTNINELRALINDYHPSIGLGRELSTPITAQGAEQACEVIRNQIRKKIFVNPIDEFNEAVKIGNAAKVYSLLSDTWFGVPESTSCWGLKGFREIVDLLDNPPEW